MDFFGFVFLIFIDREVVGERCCDGLFCCCGGFFGGGGDFCGCFFDGSGGFFGYFFVGGEYQFDGFYLDFFGDFGEGGYVFGSYFG